MTEPVKRNLLLEFFVILLLHYWRYDQKNIARNVAAASSYVDGLFAFRGQQESKPICWPSHLCLLGKRQQYRQGPRYGSDDTATATRAGDASADNNAGAKPGAAAARQPDQRSGAKNLLAHKESRFRQAAAG